jgi:hypothetical protein
MYIINEYVNTECAHLYDVGDTEKKKNNDQACY